MLHYLKIWQTYQIVQREESDMCDGNCGGIYGMCSYHKRQADLQKSYRAIRIVQLTSEITKHVNDLEYLRQELASLKAQELTPA